MTEERSEQGSPDSIYQIAMERERIPLATHAVVILPPMEGVPGTTEALAAELAKRNCLPLLLPKHIEGDRTSESVRYYPRDSFIQVGPWLFIPELMLLRHQETNFSQVLRALETVLPAAQINTVRDRIVPAPHQVDGTALIHLNQARIAICDDIDFDVPDVSEKAGEEGPYSWTFREPLDALKKVIEEGGWQWETTTTDGIHLPGENYNPQDTPPLDMLMSLFWGKDKKAHAVVADIFRREHRSPLQKLFLHSIPNEEAVRGACSTYYVNDHLLLVPYHEEAPSTYKAIMESVDPSVEVLETPKGFFGPNGGNRNDYLTGVISSLQIKY